MYWILAPAVGDILAVLKIFFKVANPETQLFARGSKDIIKYLIFLLLLPSLSFRCRGMVQTVMALGVNLC